MLPRELRDMVYGFVLSNSRNEYSFPKPSWYSTVKNDSSLGLVNNLPRMIIQQSHRFDGFSDQLRLENIKREYVGNCKFIGKDVIVELAEHYIGPNKLESKHIPWTINSIDY